jgi:hypothetical protein
LPGGYALRLELPGYSPVQETIEMAKNHRDTLSFTLYTKGFLDSSNVQKRELKNRKKLGWQIVFGILTAAAGATGVYLNGDVKKDLSNEKNSYSAYSTARLQSDIDLAYTEYSDNVKKTDAAILRRNIAYGAAGAFGFVFALTFLF